ncbi:interleukin-1 receptor type 1 [Garra rufa]|uniref:interleukin-1 receptor type 1 n=1 Tax=Garra rufa TaxID=137080 RepID=UPI003CCEAE82
MSRAEEKLRRLRQGGRELERYVEDFLELSHQVGWPDASLGAVFIMGLDDETIHCDLPACNFPLIELVNLILCLNGSNFEVEEIPSISMSHLPAPSEARRIEPACRMPGTPAYRANGSNHQPSLLSPVILQSSADVLSPMRPAPSPRSSLPASSPHSSPPAATPELVHKMAAADCSARAPSSDCAARAPYSNCATRAPSRMKMMLLQIILLLTELVLVSTYALNSTVQCERTNTRAARIVKAGESLYLPCPTVLCNSNEKNHSYVWFRNLSTTKQVERIGTEESDRVHYHNSVLYILWLNMNDTGRYITQWWYEEDECDEYETDVVVYEEFNQEFLFSDLVEKKASRIHCPVCEQRAASFIWYKNFSLIPNQESKSVLRIRNSSKEDEGIYTCVCTWEHNGTKHNSSGSRRLIITEQTISKPPKIVLPINNSIVIADVGSEVILNCSVFFGLSVCERCSVHWEMNEIPLSGLDGLYKLQHRKKNGTVQLVLTIAKVSVSDHSSVFRCRAEDSVEVIYAFVTLKSPASVLPVILGCICTFLVFLLVGGILKWFALDLVLFLRQISIKLYRKEDGKLYDAYVIYQSNNLDEMTTKAVSDFVNGSLLTVLESYYGFKLFIHGRDDLPGEDCMNLIETKIQLSRRLIIILTATADESSVSPEAYDLQVGLHQALVQGETGVIVIQLGQMQDYTHLPLGLQHLLWKNSPLLWKEGKSSPKSRFWKQVRYRMPVTSSSQRRRTKTTSLTTSFQCQSLLV